MNPAEDPTKQEGLNLKDVDTDKLISRLEEYNKHFNFGAAFVRYAVALKKEEKEGFEGDAADEILMFENMKRETQPILDATGLELKPVAGAVTIKTPEGNYRPSEMKLNLTNGEQFLTYLRALNSESLTASQVGGLRKVAFILVTQLKSHDLEDPNNEALLELMASASKIIEEYKRIFGDRLPKSTEALEEYLSLARQGCLKEYRMAENLHLVKSLPEKQQGVPLRWLMKTTPEYLETRWNKVLETLQIISQNPKAREIYEQARVTAQESLDRAINEVEKWKDAKSPYKIMSLRDFPGILNSVKNRLAEF